MRLTDASGIIWGYSFQTNPLCQGCYLPLTSVAIDNEIKVVVSSDSWVSGTTWHIIKAGCLPVSDQPYFYIVDDNNNYLAVTFGGVQIFRATPENEANRKWVFEEAGTVTDFVPGLNNTNKRAIYIYNLLVAPSLRLDVQYLTDFPNLRIQWALKNPNSKSQKFIVF